MAINKKEAAKKVVKKTAAPATAIAAPKKAFKPADTLTKGTIVAKGVVTRKTGMLYYINKGGDVIEKAMNRKGGKVGRKICK